MATVRSSSTGLNGARTTPPRSVISPMSLGLPSDGPRGAAFCLRKPAATTVRRWHPAFVTTARRAYHAPPNYRIFRPRHARDQTALPTARRLSPRPAAPQPAGRLVAPAGGGERGHRRRPDLAGVRP